MSVRVTLLAVIVLSLSTVRWAAAQSDVTQPGDPIQLVNGTNDGDPNAGAPPAAEGVEHAIDNVGQKYLNFLDFGSGFIVTPQVGPTYVTGLRLYTANDAEPRDPASFLLEGAASAAGPWTTIASDSLALPAGRNAGGNNPLDASDPSDFFQTILFSNTTGYASYQLTFPTLKDATSANSMQIAEVELLGTIVPEPATLGLLALSAFAVRRRRA